MNAFLPPGTPLLLGMDTGAHGCDGGTWGKVHPAPAWVAQRGLLAWGALRCISLSAIWLFQGDVLIFCQPGVTAASSRAIPERGRRQRAPLPSLSRLMHAAAPNMPGQGESRGKPGLSQGRRLGPESGARRRSAATSCSRHRAAPIRAGRLLGEKGANHNGIPHGLGTSVQGGCCGPFPSPQKPCVPAPLLPIVALSGAHVAAAVAASAA